MLRKIQQQYDLSVTWNSDCSLVFSPKTNKWTLTFKNLAEYNLTATFESEAYFSKYKGFKMEGNPVVTLTAEFEIEVGEILTLDLTLKPELGEGVIGPNFKIILNGTWLDLEVNGSLRSGCSLKDIVKADLNRDLW